MKASSMTYLTSMNLHIYHILPDHGTGLSNTGQNELDHDPVTLAGFKVVINLIRLFGRVHVNA